MDGSCRVRGRNEKCIQKFGQETERKRLCGPRYRLEDNTIMYLRETGWEVMCCIHLAQVRGQWRSLVYTIMNLRVIIKDGKFLDYLSDC